MLTIAAWIGRRRNGAFHTCCSGQDRIDPSAIDADTATALNDACTFFTGAFTAAGQVRVAGPGGPHARIVEVDVKADLAPDMQTFVSLQTTMAVGDFIL